jgi:hypothetical protein
MSLLFAYATSSQQIGINDTPAIFDTVSINSGKGIIPDEKGSTFTCDVHGIYKVDVNLVVLIKQDENFTGTVLVNGKIVPGTGMSLRVVPLMQAIVPSNFLIELEKGDELVVACQSTTGEAFLKLPRGSQGSGSSIAFVLEKRLESQRD